ncbi:MAG: hypothetical protein LAO06_04520 [Acidobacteriia bacterium]|nr:hypothetical protein [Terriglobia bacterium]
MADEENGREAPIPALAPAPEPPTPAIPEIVVPAENRPLRFSFKHLDTANRKFQLADCNAEFFRALVERIRDYSSWTVDDFCDQNNNEHRHVIHFPDTTEPNGFAGLGFDPDQLEYHEAWQFELSPIEEWRVHGILIDDTFYIIWLDADHNLYP